MTGGLVTYSGSQNLQAGALALRTTITATGRAANFVPAVANRRKLDHVTLHAASTITETVTLTYRSRLGASYDVVLDTEELVGAQDYQYVPLSPIYLGPGDDLELGCSNDTAVNVVVYGEIVCEE